MVYNFVLDKRRKSKKGYPIGLRIYLNGKQKIISLKKFSDCKHWDKSKQRLKKSHDNFLAINAELDRINIKASKLLVEKEYHNLEHFSSDLFSKQKGQIISSLVNQIDFNSEKSKELYFLVLKDFINVCGDLEVKRIQREHVIKFKEYKSKTTSNNGLHVYLRTLRAIYYRYDKNISIFEGLFPKPKPTIQKELSLDELRFIFDFQPRSESIRIFKKYAQLQFLLGGVDFIDLSKLKWYNVKDNRVNFNRGKGGSDAFISNLICKEALDIINEFNCKPYLLPIYKKDYSSHRNNYAKRLSKALGFKFTTKTMRYTFINIAKDINIREDVAMQLVGHIERTTHSIYKGRFSNDLLDEAHMKIIKTVL